MRKSCFINEQLFLFFYKNFPPTVNILVDATNDNYIFRLKGNPPFNLGDSPFFVSILLLYY